MWQQGAVGLAIWVPSVATQQKETEVSDTKHSARAYSILSPSEDKSEDTRRITGERDDIELSIIGNASTYQPTDVEILLENLKVSLLFSLVKLYRKRSHFFIICSILFLKLEVLYCYEKYLAFSFYYQVSQAMSDNYLKVSPSQSIREALNCMSDGQQNCALVVDADDYLEGILTYGDINRWLFRRSGDASSWSTTDVCFFNNYLTGM